MMLMTPESRSRSRSRSRDSLSATSPRTIPWRAVWAIAGAKVAFQLATSTVYGLHRDELYYLAAGRHLAWGFVDQPPVVPFLYRVSELLFGASTTGLRVVPALLGGVYVLLGVLLVAELGGGRRAQLLAAVVAAFGPLYLTVSHFLSTVSLDIVAWAAASWLVLRLVRTANTRLWVAVGAVVGIGLLTKDTMAFWVLGAIGGLLFCAERQLLVNRWVAVGAALAAALVAPNVVWQVQHHWATLEFARRLRADNGPSDLIQFFPLQLAMVTLAGTVVWLAALRAIATRPAWKPYRWLAVGYLLCLTALFGLAGKAYYLGSWYLPLVAAGAVAVERHWAPRAARRLIAAVVATGLLTAPLFTPILPPRVFVAAGLDNVNKDLGGMLGWHGVVDQIATVVRALPPDEQRRPVIFTATYGVAGAVDLYGAELGLPPAISGHNTYWWWGHPGPDSTAVVAVGLRREFLATFWDHVELAATLGSHGGAVDPEQRGAPIWVCTGQRVPWSAIWPAARHYS